MYETSERRPNIRRAWAASTLMLLASIGAPVNLPAQAVGLPVAALAPPRIPESISRPHPLENEIADVIVRLSPRLCSGTPVAGTDYIVTAAHCVMDANGEVITRTVVRDGVVYTPTAVLVDTA